MIELGIIFTLYVVGSLVVISRLSDSAKEERRELENRLMAFANPQALLLHKTQEDPVEASISYVDDESRDDNGPGL